jgi:hypothetical protein
LLPACNKVNTEPPELVNRVQDVLDDFLASYVCSSIAHLERTLNSYQMSFNNPLETYLSAQVQRPPPFIYLHHPFHTPPQALPAALAAPNDTTASLPTSSPATARVHNSKIVLTIPASAATSPKTLYTLVLHLVRLCLFPESVQREIEEKGKVREVYQWDTFVRGLSRILDADASDVQKSAEERKVHAGDKRKRANECGDDQDHDQDQPGEIITRSVRVRRTLVMICQDAHLLAKNIGIAFESLLRLSKMVSHVCLATVGCRIAELRIGDLSLSDRTSDEPDLDLSQGLG